jgi:photosystem II stability/assembly factor-like uncharacterized protein
VSERFELYVSTQAGLFRGKLNGSLQETSMIGLNELGRIWPIVVDHHNPDRLYAATHRGGVFRSDDRGRTWNEKNAGILYKEAWSIAQHPDTGELFVGTGPAAVFTSVDYGEHWKFCEQLHTLPETKDWTFPNPPHIAHVKGLTLSRSNPDVIFGAIEEGWLIRSEDRGATWTTLKNGTEYDSHTVSIMPDSRVLLSASGTGIYRSEDFGEHFVPAKDGLTRTYVSQIVFHDREPNILFTAAAEVPPQMWRRPQGANSQFYRSVDQGKSWAPIVNGLPETIIGAPRATTGCPDTPGSFLVGMNDGSIWMTSDHGGSFDQIATGLPPIFGLTVSRNR